MNSMDSKLQKKDDQGKPSIFSFRNKFFKRAMFRFLVNK